MLVALFVVISVSAHPAMLAGSANSNARKTLPICDTSQTAASAIACCRNSRSRHIYLVPPVVELDEEPMPDCEPELDGPVPNPDDEAPVEPDVPEELDVPPVPEG
jgi:hypothetical protein